MCLITPSGFEFGVSMFFSYTFSYMEFIVASKVMFLFLFLITAKYLDALRSEAVTVPNSQQYCTSASD